MRKHRAPGGDRTLYLSLFRRSLYQVSYTGRNSRWLATTAPMINYSVFREPYRPSTAGYRGKGSNLQSAGPEPAVLPIRPPRYVRPQGTIRTFIGGSKVRRPAVSRPEGDVRRSRHPLSFVHGHLVLLLFLRGLGGTRTLDLSIKSRLLFHLSYQPARAVEGIRTPAPPIKSRLLYPLSYDGMSYVPAGFCLVIFILFSSMSFRGS